MMLGLSKLWSGAPVRPPSDIPVPVDSSAHTIAALEARLNAQPRELGRLRAEDALKATVIADLRAKLDRFTSPRKRDSCGRYLPTTEGEAAHV